MAKPWLRVQDLILFPYGPLKLDRAQEDQADRPSGSQVSVEPNQIWDWITDAYMRRGEASFFGEEWLGFDLEEPFLHHDQKIFASQVRGPWRSVQQHEVSASTPWSETARLCQTFMLAPVYPNIDDRDLFVSPFRFKAEHMKGMCIRVASEEREGWSNGETGLLGWSNHWKGSTNRADVLDAATITLTPRDESFVSIDSVDRFEQRFDGKIPKVFSAWLGIDKKAALKKASRDPTKPEFKVGLRTVLLTKYEPVSTVRT